MLEFHPALTYERFCDLFSVIVGGITVENRTGYFLGVLVNALQSLNALQSVFTRQYSAERSGDLFHSFAARDPLRSLLTKRHTYYSLIRTCFHMGQKYQPMLLNCVLVYWCCAILVRGFRCVKQHETVV